MWFAAQAPLQANARQPEIGKLIDDAMVAIERENPQIKGVLSKDYARPTIDKTQLGEPIDLIGTITMGEAESRSKDILGRVYEYFLGRFAGAEGKGGGEFSTARGARPREPRPLPRGADRGLRLLAAAPARRARRHAPHEARPCPPPARLDGKWLLRTSDETLTAEDLALAYKQLYQVKRGWRDMKEALALRPVFHHREDGIRVHVQLCWLALLLIRVVENATGESWRCVRDELERMHLVTLKASEGRVVRSSQTAAGQRRPGASRAAPLQRPRGRRNAGLSTRVSGSP